MVKRAVSFACNYFGTRSELRGCINDSKLIKNMLINVFNYEAKNVLVITDKKNNKVKPTRDTILNTLKRLISETKNGDTLFVHFSGHGTHTRDRAFRSLDEVDKKDEMICPCDNKFIRDDELYDVLVAKLVKGAKLRVVLDCCHSGSALDLPFRYNNLTRIVVENKRKSDKDCIMISGCEDPDVSSDAYISGNFKGALTWALTKTIKDLHKAVGSDVGRWTWVELITTVRYNLRNKRFKQVPQLNATNKALFDQPLNI